MRRILSICTILCMLCGCAHTGGGMEQALTLRETIINGNGCSFKVMITADYQDVYYTFTMNCQSDAIGNISFEVIEPESINGITGCVSAEEGKLTFDDKVLMFATLAEGQISPVSAPWLFVNALRGGYIKGCTQDDNRSLLQINDSYADDAIQFNIQMSDGIPESAEIIWKNRRVVTMDVEAFRIL